MSGVVSCQVWCHVWCGVMSGVVSCMVLCHVRWCHVWCGVMSGVVSCLVWCHVWCGVMSGVMSCMVWCRVWCVKKCNYIDINNLKKFNIFPKILHQPATWGVQLHLLYMCRLSSLTGYNEQELQLKSMVLIFHIPLQDLKFLFTFLLSPATYSL